MTGEYPFRNYRILFTPLVSENVYGTTIDVTQDVDLTDFVKSIGTIKREIDNGDYDIGIFTFGDITLNMVNYSRKFNSPHDAASMFGFMRDRCKVEVVFYDEDGNSSTRFKGLINDDATRMDFATGIIRFKVLSLDSIFRQVEVPAGAIVNGDLFSTAIKKILNVPAITTTLTYSASNVTCDLDLEIDDGEVFSEVSAKEALEQLLLASNSILWIDNTDTLHVQARTESAAAFYLYGEGDKHGRENILKIKDYNDGIQRAFSSVKVGDVVSTSEAWVAEYGFRQKEITLDCLTDETKQGLVANKVLDAFQVPKEELILTVSSNPVSDIELLDTVYVDNDFRNVPAQGDTELPMWGSIDWGSFNWAKTTGVLRIFPKTKWKVVGIAENAKNFTVELKLRVAGTELHDGVA